MKYLSEESFAGMMNRCATFPGYKCAILFKDGNQRKSFVEEFKEVKSRRWALFDADQCFNRQYYLWFDNGSRIHAIIGMIPKCHISEYDEILCDQNYGTKAMSDINLAEHGAVALDSFLSEFSVV